MCMEDEILGRKKRTAVTVITVTPGSIVVIASQDPMRTHLYVGVTSGTAWVAPFPVDPGVGGGTSITKSGFTLDLDTQRHGDVVCAMWGAIGDTANAVLTVIETFLDKIQ